MGHDFSRQITEKCRTKYGNGNYNLEHPKWKWELYFGTDGVFFLFLWTFWKELGHCPKNQNKTYNVKLLDLHPIKFPKEP